MVASAVMDTFVMEESNDGIIKQLLNTEILGRLGINHYIDNVQNYVVMIQIYRES